MKQVEHVSLGAVHTHTHTHTHTRNPYLNNGLSVLFICKKIEDRLFEKIACLFAVLRR